MVIIRNNEAGKEVMGQHPCKLPAIRRGQGKRGSNTGPFHETDTLKGCPDPVGSVLLSGPLDPDDEIIVPHQCPAPQSFFQDPGEDAVEPAALKGEDEDLPAAGAFPGGYRKSRSPQFGRQP